MSMTVFLSHIHEETALALVIKEAIEDEFAGFVKVFVSSDGQSIPAGANFLNKIEDALVDCVGSFYLISPISVKRSWISFELGAVWIRNAMSLRRGKSEIPTIPLCHSGVKKGELPSPISNLNAIDARSSAQLEYAFRSIQTAVGVKGKLRTDFDVLSAAVISFEKSYSAKAIAFNFSELLLRDVNREGVSDPYPAFVNLINQLSSDEAKLLKIVKQFETPYGEVSNPDAQLALRNKINQELEKSLQHPEKIMIYTDHIESLGLIQFMGYDPPDDWTVFYVLPPGEINGHIGITAFGYDFLNSVLP